MKRASISVKLNYVIGLAAGILLLNIAVFIGGWIRLRYALPLIFLIALLMFLLWKKIRFYDQKFDINLIHFLLFAAIIIIWCILSGQGGFFYQPGDWIARNPIYHDLLQMDWPVIYSDGSMLCYYIGYWQLPAFLSKAAGLSLRMADVILLIYTAVLLLLVLLLLFHITKAFTVKKQYTVLLILIFFSGLDKVVQFIFNYLNDLPLIDVYYTVIDNYFGAFYNAQYNSNSTELAWVFNQSVISWLTCCLFLIWRDKKCYWGFLACSLFFYSPFACIGLLMLMLSSFLYDLFRCKDYKQFFKGVFSIENFLSLPFFVILLLYFTANLMTSKVGNSSLHFQFIDSGFFYYLLFVLFEFLIYTLVMFRSFKKDIIFISVNVSLLILPFFVYGKFNDLCMRGAIPSLFILMIYVLHYLFKPQTKKLILVTLLCIGSATPVFFNYVRGIREMQQKGTVIQDYFLTFDGITAKTKREDFLNNYFARDLEQHFIEPFLKKNK